MLDIRKIRNDPEGVTSALSRRGDASAVDKLILLDREKRALITEGDRLKKEKNAASKMIAGLLRDGGDTRCIMEDQKGISAAIKETDRKVGDLDKEIRDMMLNIPNIPDISVQSGGDKRENTFVSEWGTPREFDFDSLPHWEIGEKLKILDFAAPARMSGAHFPLFRGLGARLERALFSFMIDLHVEKHGYLEICPPLMVKRDSMVGTGQLPKMEGDMYLCEEDDLFLVPTAEVPLVNLHREEVMEEPSLPLKYVAYTPCFRREAGSYGKETRGLLRVHQFDKVEMVCFTRPSDSYKALEEMLGHAEEVLRLLGLPYRVWQLCAEEISFASSKTYDIEVWAAGIGKWLEVASISNCEDFQARRAKVRCKKKGEKGTFFPHTLNGSGVALARTFLSICENCQQADGTIRVPPVLVPYMGGVEVIA